MEERLEDSQSESESMEKKI